MVNTSEELMGRGLGLGHGLKTALFRTRGLSYGITPYAYRYSAASMAHYLLSTKMTWDGANIPHHDITHSVEQHCREQAFMADEAISIAPGVSIGLGARVFY